MSRDPSKPNRRQRRKEQFRLPLFKADPEEPDKEQNGSTGEQEEENFKPMLTQIYDFLFRDKAAAWTAIFTCVLAVFSYLLLKVSDQATQIASNAQAAAVSSIGPAILKVPNADGKTLKGYNIIFNWINNGASAARTVSAQANVYIGVTSPTKDLDFSQLPQDRVTTTVIPPRAAVQLSPGFATLQDIEDVQAGRKHMFFWGWAVYKDGVSTVPRLSEYCFNVEGAVFTKPDHTDFTGDTTVLTNPCGVHFCFNEECEDYKARTK